MKAIRDRIPEIAAARGDYITVRTATAEEFRQLLIAKLSEELAEYKDGHSVTELADLVEVAYAIEPDLDAHRTAKARTNGAFTQRLVLVDPA